jgi:DNA-binding PadR family transcriptional regulator
VEKRKEVAGTTVQTIYTLTEEGAELFRDYLRFLEELLQQKGGNR